jgi:putative acetyltransferase
MSVSVRPIEKKDDQALAKIIRASLTEFGVPEIGTVYSDPTTDHLSALFETAGSSYFVAEEDGNLIGGCGIYPTPGLPSGCAELVKLYLTTTSRGKGLGKLLMDTCFNSAKELGYTQLYLESFPQLDKAVSMYLKAGFSHLPGALGNSGHHACTVWMMKSLY